MSSPGRPTDRHEDVAASRPNKLLAAIAWLEQFCEQESEQPYLVTEAIGELHWALREHEGFLSLEDSVRHMLQAPSLEPHVDELVYRLLVLDGLRGDKVAVGVELATTPGAVEPEKAARPPRVAGFTDKALDDALDLLARVPYESGMEIGELIEERRADMANERQEARSAAQGRPRFAVRISRGLVTHWNDEPLLTWEQADECRRKIEELQHERGEVGEVLLSVEA